MAPWVLTYWHFPAKFQGGGGVRRQGPGLGEPPEDLLCDSPDEKNNSTHTAKKTVHTVSVFRTEQVTPCK